MGGMNTLPQSSRSEDKEQGKERGWRSALGAAVLAMAVAFVIYQGCAFAQDSPPAGPPDQGGSMGAGPGGGMGGAPRGHRPSVDDQVKHLTRQLNLSEDQQAKVKSALEDQRKQNEQLRDDSSLSRDDRFSKMRQIHEATTTQIKSVLNEDQGKKYDAILAQQRSHGRPGGGPPSGDAPPSGEAPAPQSPQ